MDEEGYRIIFIAHRLCLCKTLMIFTTAPCQDAYWIIASALGFSSPANHGEVIVVRPQIQDFLYGVGMGMGLATSLIMIGVLYVSGDELVNYLLRRPRRDLIDARDVALGVLSGAPRTDDEDEEGSAS